MADSPSVSRVSGCGFAPAPGRGGESGQDVRHLGDDFLVASGRGFGKSRRRVGHRQGDLVQHGRPGDARTLACLLVSPYPSAAYRRCRRRPPACRRQRVGSTSMPSGANLTAAWASWRWYEPARRLPTRAGIRVLIAGPSVSLEGTIRSLEAIDLWPHPPVASHHGQSRAAPVSADAQRCSSGATWNLGTGHPSTWRR